MEKVLSNDKIEVLPVVDHEEPGYVRLVNSVGDDLSIVRSARVSYDSVWRTGEDEGADEKLINYLMKNHHTSPFECVSFTFQVKAPIFVLRQWHRHRTWSYNEMSGRYTELNQGFWAPKVTDITTQSTTNKQMRTDVPNQYAESARELIVKSAQTDFETYRILLEAGVPREIARTVLPVSTYSTMFASVNLHNLLHFLKLRLHPHAQQEIRVYAQAMLQLIEPIVPVTVAAFKRWG